MTTTASSTSRQHWNNRPGPQGMSSILKILDENRLETLVSTQGKERKEGGDSLLSKEKKAEMLKQEMDAYIKEQ